MPWSLSKAVATVPVVFSGKGKRAISKVPFAIGTSLPLRFLMARIVLSLTLNSMMTVKDSDPAVARSATQ